MSNLDGLTSGISTQIEITNVDGVKKFEILESFHSVQVAPILSETAIDGITRHPQLHREWTGTLVFQRGSNVLDLYVAERERFYYEGGDQVNLTVTQTIKELNGTVTRFQFTDLVLEMEDGGTYSGTDIVRQSFSWKCRRRIVLS